MISIGLRYLTNYVAATSSASREVVEWPPHPGRVFMGLAATHFETRSGMPEHQDEEAKEYQSLLWLERQPPPALRVPDCDQRSVVDVFVPPNDMGHNKLTAIPRFRTNRQPRTFPRAWLHDETVYLIWKDANPDKATRTALDQLCSKLIRIGHSSSFVQAWVADPGEKVEPNYFVSEEGENFRIPTIGTLDYLVARYGEGRIERFHELSENIQTSKGKGKDEFKAVFEAEFGEVWRNSLPVPEPLPPVLSSTARYAKVSSVPSEVTHSTCFDANLVILTKQEGPNLGLESTWQLLTALRGTIESICQPTPEWVSGHQSCGVASENCHLALLPLAFVGSQYADGHLLGAALAFPKEISMEDRAAALGCLLYDAKGKPVSLELKLGRLGVWSVSLEERASPPLALDASSWTKPSKTWASVSPVVLDRHPRTDSQKDRVGWVGEVAEIVSTACERIGLPTPAEVDIDKTSWHRGAPRSRPGKGGYALMPSKPGNPVRPQVHVWLRFAEAVKGPVILGAGRYRGYGLCKPWTHQK